MNSKVTKFYFIPVEPIKMPNSKLTENRMDIYFYEFQIQKILVEVVNPLKCQNQNNSKQCEYTSLTVL